MMLLLFVLSTANAAPPPALLRSWSATEALPDFYGERLMRFEQQFAAQVPVADGWHLEGMGSVRDPAAMSAPTEGDLLRLSVHYDQRRISVGTGRLVRSGTQGLEPIDGVLFRGEDMGTRVDAWGGRVWHPEGVPDDETWVIGTEIGARSSQHAGLSSTIGWEGRASLGQFANRGFASVALRGAREGQLSGMLELGSTADPQSLPLRSALRAARPFGRFARIGASARWEGLAPVASTTNAPMNYLAPDGYGIVDAEARLNLGPVSLDVSGGPTLRPAAETSTAGPDVGSMGRGGLRVNVAAPVWLGIGALSAQASDSAIAGGLGEVGIAHDDMSLRFEGAIFDYVAQTGPVARVWEARLLGAGPTWRPRQGALQTLQVRAQISTGTDRILQPWVRGGAVLIGDFGGGRP